MGLDSVELLISIEDFFGIRIPDAHAENIYTVADMVNEVAVLKGISSDEMNLRHNLLNQIKTDSNLTGLTYSDTITTDEHELWNKLKNALNSKIPKPESRKLYPILMLDCIDAILAQDYLKFIGRTNITSKYEIYIGVKGITSDRLGVDLYEIDPSSNFVNDFGID